MRQRTQSAVQGAADLGDAGPNEAENAQNLSASHLKGHTVERARHVHILDHERDIVRHVDCERGVAL